MTIASRSAANLAFFEVQPEFNRSFASKSAFETVLKTLRDSIADADLMVLHEIDTRMILRKGGIEIGGLTQILYFHPRYMKRLLDANPSAVIEAPLKWAVRETPRGEVICHCIRPSYLFGRYAGLESFGLELDEIVEKIATSIE